MKIYLINLDRSSERLEWMKRVLAERGLEFQRIDAVDAGKMSAEEIRDQKQHYNASDLVSPGDLGCFLSHRKCWQTIVDAKDDYACVLEDDLHMSKDAGKFLSSSDWIPSGTDVVKIETYRRKLRYRRSPAEPALDRKLVQLADKHLGTGGYIISRDCARSLLELTTSDIVPVDSIMFDPEFDVSTRLNVVQLLPALCIQDMRLNRGNVDSPLASTIRAGRDRMFGGYRPGGPMQKLKREYKRFSSATAESLNDFYAIAFRGMNVGTIPFKQ